MEYILLDTNILIYREGEKALTPDVQLLSRLLIDSVDFRLCVHPLSIVELSKHKDVQERETILSKVLIYEKLENLPKISDEFLKKCKYTNNSHDDIDNNLLFAIYSNCATYLITNDKGIIKKADIFGLSDRVLTIQKAINLFLINKDFVNLKTPAAIQEEYLYNIDTSDEFFDSLREDYFGFDNWLEKKKRNHEKVRVLYKEDKKIGAFLMLKEEFENEDYSNFDTPFEKGKRIKIATFKVEDRGKSIGETFIKIAVDYAIEKGINELYLSVYNKQEKLISLIKEYGFNLFTYKNTKRQDGSIGREGVYLKRFNYEATNYPIIKLNDQKVYILSIRDEFAHMLFPDLFDRHQLSIYDIDGSSTYSNTIKKVYISKSKIEPMKNNDILVFYISQIKKCIACVCVVDDAFKANEINSFESFEKIVKRRTVYPVKYLKEAYENSYLIIMFKYFINLQVHISLEKAIEENIIKSAPQSIQLLERGKFEKLISLSGSEKQIII